MKVLWRGIKNIVSLELCNLDRISHIAVGKRPPFKVQGKYTMNSISSLLMLQVMTLQRRSQEIQIHQYLTCQILIYIPFLFPHAVLKKYHLLFSLKRMLSLMGPNSIPIKLFKILDPQISLGLSTQINETGALAHKFKIAKEIPVF